MIKLTSKFPIVYKDKDLVFPITETENTGTVYPAKDTEYAEFDTYDEAKAFVESKGLSYKEFKTTKDINNKV